MKAVFVGEAWGQHEDRFGHALVGPSGRELGRMLHEAGISPPLSTPHPSELEMIRFWKNLRENNILHVTNVFNEHPPDNNNSIFFDRDGDHDILPIKIKSSVKYIRPEFRHHLDRLRKELCEIRPNLIVAMGNVACWGVLGQTSITKIRGTIQYGLPFLGEMKTLPTLHPAFILHEGGWNNRPVLIADLMKARREMEFPEIRRPERWITVAESLLEIKQWFNRPAEKYAVDIESGYALYSRAEIKNMESKLRRLLSEQISMVSFARKPSDMIVIQFMKRPNPNDTEPSMNFWPNIDDEIEAWRLTIRGLKTRVPKVFQNGLYDIGRFLAMGILPAACWDDTMLCHHALYPEMLKNLGFLGSIYVNDIAWKTAYGNREQLKRDE